MFDKTKILSLASDGSVEVRTVDSIRLAGRASVQVRISPEAETDLACSSLRRIADFLEENSGPEGSHPQDAAA